MLIVLACLRAAINGIEVESDLLSNAFTKLSVKPEDVKTITVSSSIPRNDIAQIATTYPNLEHFSMEQGASVEGNKIPKHCFANSKLVDVVLRGVDKIGKGAFQKCRFLESVNAETVDSIGSVAFDGCWSLKRALIDKATKIGKNAFQDCRSFVTFTVPVGVSQLPNTVFHGCKNMTKLVIAGPVDVIPEEFLFGMPVLQYVGMPSTFTKCTHPGFAPSVTVELIRVPGKCPTGEVYNVPRFVNQIGDEILKGCSEIKKIHVHDKVKRIGTEAFAEMKSLAEVTFDEPSALVHIGSRAMANCPSLVTITIPRSVVTVGEMVFMHSWQLKEIYHYYEFDMEWYSEGLLSETHAKCIEIRDQMPTPENNFDKPYRSWPLRPTPKELTEEEKRPKHTSNKKPNIVFYFSDQQRWDTIGPNGQKLDITPNLDQLAREGVNFANCFSSQPVCGPLRAVLQSGQFATAVGCFKNAVPLPTDLKYRLSDQLKAAGYNIAYIGKWHLASDQGQIRYETLPIPMEYRGGWDQYWVAADVLEFTSHGYGGYIWDTDNNKREFTGYRVDCITDFALEYIRNYEDTEKPFMLFLSHIEPHHQNDHSAYEGPIGSKEMFKDFEPPPDLRPGCGDWERWMPDYLGCCWSLDKNLGRIVAALKEKGIYDDTAIIYSTDHGSHFKCRSDVEAGGGDDYKRTAYESALHIPLVIKGPGFEGGRTNHHMCATIDIAQTIVRLAGGEPGPDWKGRPLQESENGDWEDVVYVQVSESMVGRAIRTPKYSYVIHAAGKNPFNEPGSDKCTWTEKHLFDLTADPVEMNDLVNDPNYSAVRAELRELLKKKAKEAGEGDFNIVANSITDDL